ncbi:MAG: hypothetical protein EPO64_04785 [Nitrospirae bacterium]|nr:MAG: hypothetical protein EPO64_04785 [Nitrospirota bacterium]
MLTESSRARPALADEEGRHISSLPTTRIALNSAAPGLHSRRMKGDALMHATQRIAFGLVCSVFALSMPAFAADQKTTLMLGGKFCDSYLGEVQTALKKIPGVASVDLKSMKGHAIVTGEAGKTKPEQLTAAVNALKGEGWHCKAEVMK